MARTIVFGGNGFIGSHVVDELVRLGHEVAVFDRFSDPIPRYSAQGVAMIVGDVQNAAEVRAALEGQDVVFHLASSSSPATAQLDATHDIQTNLLSSVELFRSAADARVKHVYFASSGGAVYGDQAETNVSESSITTPFSPYAISKLAAERYLEYFRRTAELPYTVLRLSNPYGPRQHPMRKQGVIPIFLRHVSQDEPVLVMGDGSMRRDYIYVEDLARMIVRPLMLKTETEHRVFNLGSGEATSVTEIISAIETVTGITVRRMYAPQPSTYVNAVTLDTRRYHQTFGLGESLVTLEEGIRRTWAEMATR